MNCTKASHGNLFIQFHVIEIDLQDGIDIEIKRLCFAGALVLHAHFLELFF